MSGKYGLVAIPADTCTCIMYLVGKNQSGWQKKKITKKKNCVTAPILTLTYDQKPETCFLGPYWSLHNFDWKSRLGYLRAKPMIHVYRATNLKRSPKIGLTNNWQLYTVHSSGNPVNFCYARHLDKNKLPGGYLFRGVKRSQTSLKTWPCVFSMATGVIFLMEIMD